MLPGRLMLRTAGWPLAAVSGASAGALWQSCFIFTKQGSASGSTRQSPCAPSIYRHKPPVYAGPSKGGGRTGHVSPWKTAVLAPEVLTGVLSIMRLFVAAALAAVAFFSFTGTGQTRDAQSVISVMLAELGERRPQGCPSRWCACYMDTVLARTGLLPHGSNLARDFASYGNAAEPGAVGAIMVMANHVGVVVGQCEDGSVQIVSGNYSNQVALGCYNPSRAIAWRAPVRH